MLTFDLENQSAAPELTPAWMAQLANAMQAAWDSDFAPEWNMLPCTITVAQNVGRQVKFVDTDPTPGALAYHTRDAQGNAVLVIIVANVRAEGGNLLDALSTAASHELFESGGNPDVNLYVDCGKAPLYQAREVCDPVQGNSYSLGGIAISDFVTRAYFDPGASGPWDFCKVLTGPFQCAKGGYIAWSDGSQTFDAAVSAAKRLSVQKYGRVVSR